MTASHEFLSANQAKQDAYAAARHLHAEEDRRIQAEQRAAITGEQGDAPQQEAT